MAMAEGWEIRKAREGAGMKAKDLAAALDISPEHLSRVENGHRPVTMMLALAASVTLEGNRARQAKED